MSDGLPTEDQLRRIERGVQRRIDARRTAVHRVAGAAAALALLGGGFALVLPALGGTSGAGGGSMAAPAADRAASAAPEAVRCHATSAADSATTAADAPAGADAATVAALCGATPVDPGSDAGPEAAGGGSTAQDQDLRGQAATSAPGGAAVLCRADDGVLHVFPADADPGTLCARNGTTLR